MNQEKNKKNAEISARVAEFLEKIEVTPNNFANKLGYPRSQTVYDIINGKSAPSYDFFRRLAMSEFSETCNLDWLLTGRGEMLKTNGATGNTSYMGQPSLSNKGSEITASNQENTQIISELLSTVKQQAEEIGRLKAHIEDLERRRGDNAGDARNSNIAATG